jgi:nitrous oxide reductase accessory protein NosL
VSGDARLAGGATTRRTLASVVPLATRADAEEFLKEHHGTRILRFEEVTADVIRRVDARSPG